MYIKQNNCIPLEMFYFLLSLMQVPHNSGMDELISKFRHGTLKKLTWALSWT